MNNEGISKIAEDYSNEENLGTFLLLFLTELAELAGLKVETILLSLIDLGITVQNGLVEGLEVGDYIVCYPINRETLFDPVDVMVVFSSDRKVKSIIYNANVV